MDAATRKTYPLYSGLLRYFPDALMEVAHLSKVGNDQHNPGQPLHWAREKSTDQLDALMRHLKDAGTRDTDGERHTAKVAWRALAELQLEIERDRAAMQAQLPVEALIDALPPQFKSDTQIAKDFAAAVGASLTMYDKTDDYDARLDAAQQAQVSPPPSPPFIPMTFLRKPNTEDFGPEYEDDGQAVSDAVGVEEIDATQFEPMGSKEAGDSPYDAPPPRVDGALMIRRTSQDIPQWEPKPNIFS